jgi:putative flippase GtrA
VFVLGKLFKGFATYPKRLFRELYDTLTRYALKFGIVGLIGLATDVGIFNLLRTDPTGEGGFFTGPIGAKIVSMTVATLVTWFGNRFWTFRVHRRENFLLELSEFALIAVIGMGISLMCLAVSHYVLGFTSLLADNISGNVIGLVLATAFRFLMYRYWVYSPHRSDGLERRRRESRDLKSPKATTPETNRPGFEGGS